MSQRLGLLLALILGSAGCAATTPDLRSRTEVAFANFKVGEASSQKDLTPAQKEQLYEQARIAYQRALELDPKYAEAYIGLGRLYLLLDQEDKTLAAYQRGLKQCPQEPRLWYELGQAQCRRKDWNAALDSFRKAHDLDPDNPVYLRALGQTLAVAGQPQEALSVLTQVMRPEEAHYTIARLLRAAGQYDLSRQYLEAALRLNPDLPGARQDYARWTATSAPGTDRCEATQQQMLPEK